MLVKDILKTKPTPITVHDDRQLQDAMRLLLENKIGSLVIVDDDDNPTGIITEHDIFILAHRYRGDMMDMNVGDSMTRKLILGSPDDDIGSIAKMMMEKHIRHVPITNDKHKLVGIISIRDLVKVGTWA